MEGNNGNQGGQQNQSGQQQPSGLSWSQSSGSAPAVVAHKAPAAQPAKAVQPMQKNSNKKIIIIAAVVVVVAAAAVWGFSSSREERPLETGSTATTTGESAPAPETAVGSAAIAPANTTAPVGGSAPTIPSPQSAGLQVAVSNISVSVPTWVVIYENHNGQPGNVLGAGLFVAGRNSGVVDLLRGTLPGQTYIAGEAQDDGDHMFSMQNDPAVRDTKGDPVWVEFKTR